MIYKLIVSFALIGPSLASAVVIDLPADGDRRDLQSSIDRQLPMANRYREPSERILRVTGAVTLRVPPLDPLRRGQYLSELYVVLRGTGSSVDATRLDVSRATIAVQDHKGDEIDWRAPISSSTRVRVPWPISLFYADKLGRSLRAVLPAASVEEVGVKRVLHVRGEIIFDLTDLPEPRRADVEAQIRQVLENPARPGVKDPVDVSEAVVSFDSVPGIGNGTRFNVGVFAPSAHSFTFNAEEVDPDELLAVTAVDHSVAPAKRPNAFVHVVRRHPRQTVNDLVCRTLHDIASALMAGRVPERRVRIYDPAVHAAQRAEYRAALADRLTREISLDGVQIDPSKLSIELVSMVDECGSTLDESRGVSQ